MHRRRRTALATGSPAAPEGRRAAAGAQATSDDGRAALSTNWHRTASRGTRSCRHFLRSRRPTCDPTDRRWSCSPCRPTNTLCRCSSWQPQHGTGAHPCPNRSPTSRDETTSPLVLLLGDHTKRQNRASTTSLCLRTADPTCGCRSRFPIQLGRTLCPKGRAQSHSCTSCRRRRTTSASCGSGRLSRPWGSPSRRYCSTCLLNPLPRMGWSSKCPVRRRARTAEAPQESLQAERCHVGLHLRISA
mmetsp:Transcript_4373/g.14823  ORF Transcript_4373/g.14823 Transcript_4373/m.14823 type:complete len:245 (+) Transcript_4373:183-917(+)